jgi:hypothetical protein
MNKFALTQTESEYFSTTNKQRLAENKQNKLAYVYGGKNGFDKKDKGTAHKGECADELFGFDCSGFVAKIFNQVGIPISGNANTIFSKIKNLNNRNLSSYYYNGFVVVDELSENEITQPSNLKNGDIIFRFEKDTARHIGIVLQYKSGGTTKTGIFQSFGYRYDCIKTKAGTTCGKCDENKTKHGPIFNELNSLEGFKKKEDSIPGFRSGMLKVLRISPKIFEVEPNKIQFDYTSETKSFAIKTSRFVEIEEIKSLDENICTVQSSVFVNTCGDTTIHTVNVSSKNNINPEERQTQIVIKAKIKDNVEEKVVSIIQKGHPGPWYRIELLSQNNIFVSVDNPMPPIKIAIVDIKTGQKFDAPELSYGRAGWNSFSIWTKDNTQALVFSIDFSNSIGNYVGFDYSDYLYINTWFGFLTSGSGNKIKNKREETFKFFIYATYYHPSDGREWMDLMGSPVEISGKVEFIEYEY